MRLILAGKDAVAVDAACIHVAGQKVDEVRKDFAGGARATRVTDKTAAAFGVNRTTGGSAAGVISGCRLGLP
jgi:hypothetical protein